VLTLGICAPLRDLQARRAAAARSRAPARLINDTEERPVLFLFAGKAHPADHPGQQVLREIKQLMLTPEFAGTWCSSRTTTCSWRAGW
jgi:glucan phosphorylase